MKYRIRGQDDINIANIVSESFEGKQRRIEGRRLRSRGTASRATLVNKNSAGHMLLMSSGPQYLPTAFKDVNIDSTTVPYQQYGASSYSQSEQSQYVRRFKHLMQLLISYQFQRSQLRSSQPASRSQTRPQFKMLRSSWPRKQVAWIPSVWESTTPRRRSF